MAVIEDFFKEKKIFFEKCTGCNACLVKCEIEAIIPQNNKDGFWYPYILEDKCRKCKKCLINCPVVKQVNIDNNFSGTSYIAWNKNETVRKKSSSGGLFTAIAEEFLMRDGVVVGAAMDTDLKSVSHKIVYSMSDLGNLRGSKYLQSNIKRETYNEILDNLYKGKKVLFSGTPCQVAGLKSFFKDIPENLFTIDLVCHGVPTPMAWQKYLEFMEQKYKDHLLKVNFRTKPNGWEKFEICLNFHSYRYSCWFNEDYYGISFINNMFLRQCCYKCQFKSLSREADITLGDFWSPPSKYISDGRGYSLVLCNTKRGSEMFTQLSEKIYYDEVSLKEAFPGNYALYKPSESFDMRDVALKQLQELRFDDVIRQWTSTKIVFRIKRKLSKILKRFQR